MNVRTYSRIIAGLGIAALLIVSTACGQANGTDKTALSGAAQQKIADKKKVDEVALAIRTTKLDDVRKVFNPKLTGGEAVINADMSQITLPEAADYGVDLNGVTPAVSFAKAALGTYTSTIEKSGAVTHGDADEKWDVFVELTKNTVKSDPVKIGTYTVAKKVTLPQTAELIVTAAQITVKNIPVTESHHSYNVILGSAEFAAFGKNDVDIPESAITGLKDSDTPKTLFDVAVANVDDGSVKKTVTIGLTDDAKAKYECADVTITAVKRKELDLKQPTKITVAGKPFDGVSAIQLESTTFDSLTSANVIILRNAFYFIDDYPYNQADTFMVTITDGPAGKLITITLADGPKGNGKYMLEPSEVIVVRKKA